MKILVAGATGSLGRDIAKQLKERGHHVRGLVRLGSRKREAVASSVTEVVLGDLRDRPSLERAVAGVDAVVSTVTSIQSDKKFQAVDRDGNLALVAAAKAAGVKTFVFVSVSPNLPETVPLTGAKRAVEAAVRDSGMAWAVLQPSMFMDFWLGPFFGWDVKKGTARMVGGGDNLVGYIAQADVTAFAIACLVRPPNRMLPLGGPSSMSPNEALRIFERVAGKPFKVTRVPVAIFKIMRAVAGPFSDFFATVAGLTLAGLEGDAIDGMSARAREFNVTMTSVEDFARQQMSGSSH